MTRLTSVSHVFVDAVPDELEPGIVYVSIPYATALHTCACGCGHEVVTPLTPQDWSFTYNGESVSLDPSIGNWNFPCQSHYWIERNRVRWVGRWTPEQIERGRQRDSDRKAGLDASINTRNQDTSAAAGRRPRLLHRLLDRIFGRGRQGPGSDRGQT